jgi:methionine biosynthesis protein MetW
MTPSQAVSSKTAPFDNPTNPAGSPRPERPHPVAEKRSVDMQIISGWIEPGSRILDLGCGRGVLLEYLARKKSVFGVGVDIDATKVLGCLRRGVNAYHGDLLEMMQKFPDKFFDRTICSRTLQELNNPAEIVLEALRVSHFVTVGFVNYAFWKNRLSLFKTGSRIRNEVYPAEWYQTRTTHPVSVAEFEHFCLVKNIRIVRKVHLAGDWKNRCRFLPNWFSGHAVYDLQKD